MDHSFFKLVLASFLSNRTISIFSYDVLFLTVQFLRYSNNVLFSRTLQGVVYGGCESGYDNLRDRSSAANNP